MQMNFSMYISKLKTVSAVFYLSVFVAMNTFIIRGIMIQKEMRLDDHRSEEILFRKPINIS